MNDCTAKYRDIIDLPHHVSQTHPRMSMEQRAAQFAPFAALTGHSETIEATALRVQETNPDTENYASIQDIP